MFSNRYKRYKRFKHILAYTSGAAKHPHLRAVFSTGRVGGLNYKTYTSSLSYTDVFQIFATLAADLSDLHPGKFSLTPDDRLLASICWCSDADAVILPLLMQWCTQVQEFQQELNCILSRTIAGGGDWHLGLSPLLVADFPVLVKLLEADYPVFVNLLVADCPVFAKLVKLLVVDCPVFAKLCFGTWKAMQCVSLITEWDTRCIFWDSLQRTASHPLWASSTTSPDQTHRLLHLCNAGRYQMHPCLLSRHHQRITTSWSDTYYWTL